MAKPNYSFEKRRKEMEKKRKKEEKLLRKKEKNATTQPGSNPSPGDKSPPPA